MPGTRREGPFARQFGQVRARAVCAWRSSRCLRPRRLTGGAGSRRSLQVCAAPGIPTGKRPGSRRPDRGGVPAVRCGFGRGARGARKIERRSARGNSILWRRGSKCLGDHSPAHFHAEYGEHEALAEMEPLSVPRGDFPRRALALVLEWAALHRQGLRADWERARGGAPLEPIALLD